MAAPDAGSAADAFFDGASPEGRARYVDIQLIGQGAYSVVARAIDKHKNIPVAIKRISEVFYDTHEAKKVLREIRLLRDFRHPNIIWLHALVPPASMETSARLFFTHLQSTNLHFTLRQPPSPTHLLPPPGPLIPTLTPAPP